MGNTRLQWGNIYIGKVTPKHLIYLLLRVINLTEVTFTLPYDIFQ